MKEITDLREIQLISVGILEKLVDFLEGNDIHYFLAWGTLLGAVRHQGFIPWDDDIDIMMFREDYEQFVSLAKDGIADNIDILIPNKTPEYYFPNIRVCDNRTIVEQENINYKKHGVWVTVFPIDFMPENKVTRFIYDFETRLMCSIIYNLLSIKVEANSLFRKTIKYIERFFFPPRRIKSTAIKADRIFKKYDNFKSNYLAIVTTYTSRRKLFKKEWFDAAVTYMPFEGRDYKVPMGYSEVLTSLYGDYKELPPVDQRSPKHNYKAFWK